VITISFDDESPKIDMKMKVVRERIFEEPEVDIVTTYQKKQTVRQLLHCYHVTEEEDPTKVTLAISRS
jgi:hypothetical protein